MTNGTARTLLLLGAPLLLAGSAGWYRFGFGGHRAAGRGNGWGLRPRHVRDIMTSDPACCSPETSLRDVAEMMVVRDCGEIPVCDQARKPIGVVTDRDIVCRIVAKGHDPLQATAREAMSEPVILCTPDMKISDCAQLMEKHQVRRVPVIDSTGALCGMVAQGDIARKASRPLTAEVVEQVSRPNLFASSVGERTRQAAQTRMATAGAPAS